MTVVAALLLCFQITSVCMIWFCKKFYCYLRKDAKVSVVTLMEVTI